MMEIPEIKEIDLILLIALFVLFIIQFIYYVSVYRGIIRRNKAAKKGKTTFAESLEPVSVIIYVKDESENLSKYLPLILEQDYPNFDVIVINDGSTDETEELLSRLEEKYDNLYHSFTPESSRYISHKKLGITLGVKASKNDWVIFTEPDCFPESQNWLRTMARNCTPDTEIVLGYSGYERGKGWLNKRVSFDNLFLAMRFLGYAAMRRPYMGIGRNMAYRRELFFKHKGFSAHLNMQRGEDDLFINQIATRKNTRIEASSESVIRMKPMKRFRDFKENKVNYMVTSRLFRGSQRYWLGFETLSRLLFIGLTIAIIVLSALSLNWLVGGAALLIWILRFVIQAVTINGTAATLGEKRRYYLTLPVFDILQPLQTWRFKIYRKLRRRSDFMRR